MSPRGAYRRVFRGPGRDPDDELDEEIAFHLAEHARRLEAGGLDPDRARAEALRRFGDPGGVRRRLRRVARRTRRRDLRERLTRDLRHAARRLARAPATTLLALLILGGAVGATTTVLVVSRSVLLGPLPWPEADRLWVVWESTPEGGDRQRVSLSHLADLREDAPGLAFAASDRIAVANLGGDEGPEGIRLARVTANTLDLLGARPLLGAAFGDGAGAELLLSHGLWTRRFGADPGIVGRTVTLDGAATRVIGVMPADFRLPLPAEAGRPSAADAWATLPEASLARATARPLGLRDQDSDDRGLVLARAGAGMGPERVRAGIAAAASALRVLSPERAAAGAELRAVPLREGLTAPARPLLLAVLGAAALVMLVACCDVAHLLLAQSEARRRDLEVRLALGAERGDLVRLALAEAALLGGAAALAGVALARLGLPLVARLAPPPLAAALQAATLPRAPLGTALAVAAAAVLLATLLPLRNLRPRSGTARGSERRLGRALVVGQVALSTLLLVGAGLTVRSAAALSAVEPGFDPRGALTFRLSLRHPERWSGPAERHALVEALAERLRALPGVSAVGATGSLPLSDADWSVPWGRAGEDPAAWSARAAGLRAVTPGYLEALGLPLVRGRPLAPEDASEERRVALIDAALAARPDAPALGEEIAFPLDGRRVVADVVGVVGAVRHAGLARPPEATVYVPYRHEASRDVTVVVRTSAELAALAPAVRAGVAALAPDLPIYDLRPLADYVGDALRPARFLGATLAGFGACALALASAGLYGVLAVAVRRRRREIGIRMALGAGRGRLVAGVMGEALALTAAGLALGMVAALAAVRPLRGMLFGVGASDPLTLALVASSLVLAAVAAAALPAAEAAGGAPAAALRPD